MGLFGFESSPTTSRLTSENGGVKLDRRSGGEKLAEGGGRTRPLTWSTEHSKGVLWNTVALYRVELLGKSPR